MCTIPLLRRVCRESYNEPLAVYEKLKRLGMDLVTMTDHDSIDAAEALRSRPDFFLSEEVTCKLPSGTELHVGVYDITERDHVEIAAPPQRFRIAGARGCDERNLFFSANHVFSSLTGRRAPEDFRAVSNRAFPALETRNGHMLARANGNAAGAGRLGGAGRSGRQRRARHGARWAARDTVVPRARTKAGIPGRRCGAGQGRVRGETGGFWKLTRDVLAIGRTMVRENPWTLPLAPLGVAVPAGNTRKLYARERVRALVDGALPPAACAQGSRLRRHTHRGGGRMTFSGEAMLTLHLPSRPQADAAREPLARRRAGSACG